MHKIKRTSAVNIYCLSGYVEEIFETFMEASKNQLKQAAQELKEKTPPPMNTMLQKQPKEEALQKKAARSNMVTENVPPTTPGIIKLLS